MSPNPPIPFKERKLKILRCPSLMYNYSGIPPFGLATITAMLNQNGYQAVYISGDISQKKRQRIIEALKKGQIDFLVATDVASRGIHSRSGFLMWSRLTPSSPRARRAPPE